MADLRSFIPKNNSKFPAQTSRSLGILMFLGVILLVLSMIAFGGVFFYKGLVEGQIQELSDSLERIEADFEPSLILELSQTSKTINSARQLLSGHRSMSKVFDFLETNTLSTVRFFDFNFSARDYKLAMAAVAASYADLALQSQAFEESSLVNDVKFSNFSLSPQGGINFSVEIIFDPNIVSFR